MRGGGIHRGREAADGLASIPLAAASRPDVVILDYVMPEMNGEDTARVLRAVVPDAAIVAFSASLDGTPPWGDAFVPKDDVERVGPTLEELRKSA